jgi:hypothetical protein
MSWLSLALGLLLAVIVLLYLFLRTGFFAGLAGRLVSQHLFGKSPFVVTIDHLEGSIVRDVTLRNLRILHQRGAADAFELFRADEVTCRFSVGALLGAGRRVDEVIVVNPVFRLAADSTGAYLLPASGSGDFSTYGIERFSIHDGSFTIRSASLSLGVTGVNLDGSLHSGPGGVRVVLSRGSAAESSRRFVVRSLTGGFGLARVPAPQGSPETTRTKYLLDSLAVSLEQSFLVLDGSVVGDEWFFDVALRAAPADIDEIARLMGEGGEDWGELAGDFTFTGRPERFRASATASGVARGYALDEFHIDVRRDGASLEIDSVSGSVNGARVSGRGNARIEKPRSVELALGVEHLDIGRGFLPGVELPASDFSGAVDAACRFDPLAAAFLLDLGAGHFDGAPFAKARIRGSYEGDTLSFAEIDMSHPEHRARASGTIFDGREISFIMNVDVAKTSPIFSYLDIEEFRAEVILNGLIEGTFDEFDLRMSGSCREFEYHGTLLSEGEIRLAVEKRERYRVFCDVDGRHFRAGPAMFDSISLSLEYDEPLTRIKHLLVENPDFSASLAADIRDEGRTAAIRLGDCELRALGARWIAAGGRTIEIAGDSVRFEDVQFHSREGAIFADAVWGVDAETLDGTVRVERLALDMLSRAGLSPLALEGRVRAEVSCAGRIEDPALSVLIRLEEGRIDTFRIDAARLAATYGAGRYRIDSLVIASPSGGLSLGGEIAGVAVIDALRGRRDAIASAIVSVDAVCSDFRAAPFFSFARVPGITGGRLDGTLSVRDSLFHPIVEFKGSVRALQGSGFAIPEIDCELRLDRRSLDASGALVLSNRHRGTFSGMFPVTPAPFLYSLDRRRELALEVVVPEGDFAEVPSLTNRIAEASGRYALRFGVAGTAADPHLGGEVRISDATLRIAGMEERYTALNASILVEDSLITISRLDARRGKNGSVNAGGTVALSGWRPARYDLAVRLRSFTVESFPDITAVVTGDLRVATAVADGRAVPNVTGVCTVERADVFYDMASIGSGESGPTLAAPSLVAAVDLRIPGGTRVRTDDAQIELRGDVTLYHDRQGTHFRGDIDLIRGWYNLYNNKFNVRSGKLQFIVAGSSRPAVDIEAETRDPAGRRIYLTIRWHQDDQEPRLTLSHEDAGYSETDIWMMLGGGIVNGEGSAGASWDALGTAQNIATNYLERVLNAQMQGLTIELESPAGASAEAGTADWTDTKIAVGKYLSEGLYVKYKQALSISTAREFEVEYRLSNFILLRSQLIRYSEQALPGKSLSTSDEINVDVKLRWEF